MGRSLMPEGLLEGLDEQQLYDLFACLRISQPITRWGRSSMSNLNAPSAATQECWCFAVGAACSTAGNFTKGTT